MECSATEHMLLRDSFGSITILSIHDALIELSPYIISRFKSVIKLDLSRNYITKLLRGIFNDLSNLYFLDLSWNPLAFIDTNSLSSLNSLHLLSLSHSKSLFELLESSFAGLKSIDVLDLSNSCLTYLHPKFLGNTQKGLLNLIGSKLDYAGVLSMGSTVILSSFKVINMDCAACISPPVHAIPKVHLAGLSFHLDLPHSSYLHVF